MGSEGEEEFSLDLSIWRECQVGEKESRHERKLRSWESRKGLDIIGFAKDWVIFFHLGKKMSTFAHLCLRADRTPNWYALDERECNGEKAIRPAFFGFIFPLLDLPRCSRPSNISREAFTMFHKAFASGEGIHTGEAKCKSRQRRGDEFLIDYSISVAVGTTWSEHVAEPNCHHSRG